MIVRKDVRTVVGILALLVALAAFGLTLYLHGEDSSKIHAEKVARQVAAAAQKQASRTTLAALRKTLCPGVTTYEHLDQSSSNAVAVVRFWRGIGSLIGCPNGAP